MGQTTYATQAGRLTAASTTTSERLEIVTSVRDGIEIVHTSEYVNFLKSFFPAFKDVLTVKTSPSCKDDEDNELRYVIYEILNRLPFNEVLRPFESELLDLALSPLREENEKNALLCLRIIFDLHRNFRPSMEKNAVHFLKFVLEVYEDAEETVEELLGGSGRKRGQKDKLPSPSELSSQKSFKVMTECPLIVMLLYQLFHSKILDQVTNLVPLMVKLAGLQGGDYAAMNPAFGAVYCDLKAAQVKTASFLTYILRNNSIAHLVEAKKQEFSAAIVTLMETCPDVVATRKELLIATRHVLSVPAFSQGFFEHVDLMMDEKILVGTGPMCIENLRPLAYSFLAELVHHMKAELTLTQIQRAICIFSRNMQDNTLPLSTHMTCSRLMHHLVESIFRMRPDAANRAESRQYLMRIMYATVAKFRALRATIPELMETADELETSSKAQAAQKEKDGKSSKSDEPEKAAGDEKEKPKAENDAKAKLPSPKKLKALSDNKAIIKTLTIGMKTLLWSITNFNDKESKNAGLTQLELKQASGFVRNGVKCMQLFKGMDCTEMCSHFAEALSVLEPRNFVDIISLHFDHFFTGMLELPTMVQVPHLILQNTKLCPYFADSLMTYLLENKLACLADQSSQEAQLVLKLFSLLLHAVSKHSNCESVLGSHVIMMMESCLKAIRENENPTAYVRLLRYLFRAMAQAKFDVLYREVVPILPATLDCLLEMLNGPDTHELHDTIVELCLVLPARLSSILPHLPKLAVPLCKALRAPVNELNLLGLRTLEFWVDSLNPEFLDPCIAEVESELMLALWAMLKPQQSGSPFGAKAMQLLGKLGGRNRAFLRNPLELDAKSNPEHGLRMILMFKPDTSFLVPLDRCIVLMQNILSTPVIPNVKVSDALIHHRRQALAFIRTCLVSVLNLNAAHALSGSEEQIESAIEAAVANGWGKKFQTNIGDEAAQLGNKTKSQLIAEQNIFKQLIITVIAAECDPSLKETDATFMESVCEHMALLFVTKASQPAQESQQMDHDALERPRATNFKVLEASLFLDALMTSLESRKQAHLKATLKTISTFIDVVLILSHDEVEALQALDSGAEGKKATPKKSKKKTESSDTVELDESQYPKLSSCVEALVPRLMHCCYKQEPNSIMGGVSGLDVIMKRLPTSLLKRRLPGVLAAMIRAIQVLPAQAYSQKKEAMEALHRVVETYVPAGVTPRGDDAKIEEGVTVLVNELCSTSSMDSSREAVERSLLGIAERTSTSLESVLSLSEDALLALMERPLASRHVLAQIQLVKLINFCLSASPPLIAMKDKSLDFIREVLTIAESEDTTVLAVETRQNESISMLRQACVQLLGTALKAPEFAKTDTTPDIVHVRERITSVLFTSLTSRNSAIVSIAKGGLVAVKPHMNKNTLKQSVSPILMSLQALSKLSIPLLEALEYLLELLAEWFSPTLGEKLLEHIKYWLELEEDAAPAVPGQVVQKKSPKDVKLIAAIVNLFHLLPKLRDAKDLKPNEKKLHPFDFIKPLVRDVMAIEATMPPESVYSEANSLFAKPLAKFLSKYPKESLAYFLARLDQPEHFALFLKVIKLPEGSAVLEVTKSSSTKLLRDVFGVDAGKPDDDDALALSESEKDAELLYVNGLKLLATIVKLSPEWLAKEKAILKQLEANQSTPPAI